MYTKQDVCAVIISYNDSKAIRTNCLSVYSQVEKLLIIDNGSEDQCVEELKEIEKKLSIEIDYQKENLGIAKQLNRALEYCRGNGYKLLLTMDQDTTLCDQCVEEMIKVLNMDGQIASVGANGDIHQGSKTQKDENPKPYYETNYLITSGNLVIVEKAFESGGFFDELFIDMVDIDFSLNIREHGYKTVVATFARMKHEIGEREVRKILGREIRYHAHSPKRFYYIYRNRVIVCRKHFRKMPGYCMKMAVSLGLATFQVFIQKEAGKKLKMAMKGLKDGFTFKLKAGR